MGGERGGSGNGYGRIFAAIAMPVFIAAMDQTTVATAQPAIARDLGDAELVSWIMVAYPFAATIAVTVLGSAGDIVGRRRLLFLSLAVSIVGAGLCAAAPGVGSLIAARMVQGVGAGGGIALALAMIGELVAARDRGRFHGYVATIMVTASASGPVVGGLIIEELSWRAIFLANVPIGIAGLVLLRSVEGRPGKGRAGPFDVTGLVLLLVTVTLVFALMRHAQSDARDLRLLIGGALAAALLFVIFVRVERGAPEPFVPVRLLGQPVLWRVNAAATLHGAALTAIVTAMPLYLAAAKGVTAGEIGLLLLPLTGGIGLGSMLTGRLIGRFGRPTLLPAVGLATAALILVGAVWAEPRLDAWGLALTLGAAAFFMGTVMVSVQVTVQAQVDVDVLGVAAAATQFSRSIGAAFGAAVVATLMGTALDAGTEPAAESLGDPFRLALILVAGAAIAGTALMASVPARHLRHR